MSDAPVTVGLVGCGNISEIYLKNDARFDPFQIVACADLMPARAQQRADAFGLTAMAVDDLLADPGIEAVLNLTVPMAHADVDAQAMAAGKSVYSEKPLAVELAENQVLVRGYGDTYERGLRNFERLCEAAEGLAGRPDAASEMARRRSLALAS